MKNEEAKLLVEKNIHQTKSNIKNEIALLATSGILGASTGIGVGMVFDAINMNNESGFSSLIPTTTLLCAIAITMIQGNIRSFEELNYNTNKLKSLKLLRKYLKDNINFFKDVDEKDAEEKIKTFIYTL